MKKVILFLAIFCANLLGQTGARYLIITHDNYYNAIQPLAQWKHKKGMRSMIVKLSEIGSSSDAIKNYVVNAYNTWQIKPEYLLLVGAPNFLPYPTIDFTYTDNYYTDVDGDMFNEILSGRLTVHNTAEAQNVVNKILLYEKTPDTTDSLWFINACLIANNDGEPSSDSIYWSDVHHAKNLMLQAGWNIIDTLSNIYSNNANDVISRVNQGRSFVMYRGVGANNWWYPFACNPASCANGAKLPIVLSYTCATLGTGSTPASAEMWFLTGSVATPKGAAGYFATTTAIYNGAHLRSATCKGFFDAIFRNGKKTFGEASEGGRMRVYDMYSSASEYRGFNTIGDPEMNIWTAPPHYLTVSNNDSIYTGNQNFVVTVLHNGVPVESALVCVVKSNEVYALDTTGANGLATLNINPLYVGAMDVTVTGRNYVPFEGTCQVIGSTPDVTIQLVPDATTIELGGTLGYTTTATNNTGATVTFQYWVDVTLPNGQPYSGNPLFGPVQLTLGAGQNRNRHFTQNIPMTAPLGSYTLYGRIGWHPSTVWDEDYFDFTVISTAKEAIEE